MPMFTEIGGNKFSHNINNNVCLNPYAFFSQTKDRKENTKWIPGLSFQSIQNLLVSTSGFKLLLVVFEHGQCSVLRQPIVDSRD